MSAQFDSITVLGDAKIQGNLYPKKTRSQILQQVSDGVFHVPLEGFRIYDGAHDLLPGTAAGDDLALITGTHGTDGLYLETADGKAGNNTWYARQQIRVPQDWDAAQSLTLAIYGGMNTTISDNTATVDFSVFKMNRAGSISGSELVTDSAKDINSLTAAEQTFAIDPTTLSAGDLLDVLLSVAINDTATATAVKARFGDVRFLVDIL